MFSSLLISLFLTKVKYICVYPQKVLPLRQTYAMQNSISLLFRRLRLHIVLFLCASFSLCGCTSSLLVEATPQEVFRVFWETIDRQYANFEEHPVDWDSIYTRYWHEVCQMQSDADLLPIIDTIFTLFEDGHFSLETPDTMLHFSPTDSNYDIGPFWGVEAASYPHYSVIDMQKYDGISIGVLHPVHNWSADISREYVYAAIYSFKNHNMTASIDSLLPAWRDEEVDGIVLDIRRHHGGLGYVAYALYAHFASDDSAPVWQLYVRDLQGDRTSLKPQSCYSEKKGTIPVTMPVALIIDGGVYSAGNVFAHGMAVLPNVKVFGKYPTAGGGTSPRYIHLPNGWILSVPTGSKVYINEKSTEYPCYPDVWVEDDSAAFAQSTDLPLSRAVQWLETFAE